MFYPYLTNATYKINSIGPSCKIKFVARTLQTLQAMSIL